MILNWIDWLKRKSCSVNGVLIIRQEYLYFWNNFNRLACAHHFMDYPSKIGSNSSVNVE